MFLINRFTMRWTGGMALVVALAGCGRNQVKVYKLSNATPAQPSGDMAAPAPSDTGRPQLNWKLPSGWEEKPASGLRAASFTVSGTEGKTADVSVIPMASGEPELALVNMWRQQLQLPALASASEERPPEDVTIGSDKGKLFDMASQGPVLDGRSRARFLVAMVTRGNTSWFFKMTGEDSFVREQKPSFLEFLKSITFPSGGQTMQFVEAHRFLSTNARETPSENSEKPIWVVPPDWQEMPPSQFLLAKFQAAGAGGAKAEISVSMLGGAGGGVLANVNRWRGQLGLAPVDEAGLNNLITSMDTDGGKATCVDLTGTDAATGQPARMVAAIIPQSGQTWFYKLMGDAQVVSQQKDVFTKFVQTVKYRNVP